MLSEEAEEFQEELLKLFENENWAKAEAIIRD